MTAELNKSRIRAQAMRSGRKGKPAATSGTKTAAVAMWKRAHAEARADSQANAGDAKSKAAMWRKAFRGDDAR